MVFGCIDHLDFVGGYGRGQMASVGILLECEAIMIQNFPARQDWGLRGKSSFKLNFVVSIRRPGIIKQAQFALQFKSA